MGCCAETKDFCVGAGTTFAPVIRWGSKILTTVAITAIANSTPMLVTAPNHGVPSGWPVAVTGVKGMTNANASNYPPLGGDYHAATIVSANSVALNDVSSAQWLPYASGGSLVFPTPMPLAGGSVAMVFYDSPLKNDTPLLTLSSGSGITVDTVGYTIVPELQTLGLLWTTAYYDLNFTDANGVVTRILQGVLTITA